MRQTIFVFAVMASLLMLACSADGTTKSNFEVLFGGLTDSIKDIAKLAFKDGASDFSLSNLFGVLDDELAEIKSCGKDIDVLLQQSLKEYKDIESIRALVQAAADKPSKSGELTPIINFIAARVETGKAQISEIEKHKKTIQTAITEAEAAKTEIVKKDSGLTASVVNVLTAMPTISTADATAVAAGSDPLSVAILDLFTNGIPIGADLYSQYQRFNKASAKIKEVFQEAELASKTIKQSLTESQELQKYLKPQS